MGDDAAHPAMAAKAIYASRTWQALRRLIKMVHCEEMQRTCRTRAMEARARGADAGVCVCVCACAHRRTRARCLNRRFTGMASTASRHQGTLQLPHSETRTALSQAMLCHCLALPWPTHPRACASRCHADPSSCFSASLRVHIARFFVYSHTPARSQGGSNFDKSDPHPPAYKQPVTAASNLSKSYYFNRDQRRKDLGFPEVFAGDSAKALPAPAAATAAPVVEGPPVPGRPFEWKNSQVSDYATRYL